MVNKMNKTKLKQIIKEELQATLNENEGDTSPWSVAQDLEINQEYSEDAHGGDSLDELESIAAEFEEVAALSPSAMIQRRLRELIERLRNALETHRDQWGSDPN